jgi:hypothetical protein
MEKYVVRGFSLAKAPPSDLKRSHYFVGLILGLTREETRGAQALTSPGAPQEIAMALRASRRRNSGRG